MEKEKISEIMLILEKAEYIAHSMAYDLEHDDLKSASIGLSILIDLTDDLRTALINQSKGGDKNAL